MGSNAPSRPAWRRMMSLACASFHTGIWEHSKWLPAGPPAIAAQLVSRGQAARNKANPCRDRKNLSIQRYIASFTYDFKLYIVERRITILLIVVQLSLVAKRVASATSADTRG